MSKEQKMIIYVTSIEEEDFDDTKTTITGAYTSINQARTGLLKWLKNNRDVPKEMTDNDILKYFVKWDIQEFHVNDVFLSQDFCRDDLDDYLINQKWIKD
jgi:hypothetical protein